MADVTRLHPGCHGKRRFASRRAALRSRAVGKERLHPYVCAICRHWHMGHAYNIGGDFIQAATRAYRRRLEAARIADLERDHDCV